ncbi:hypothetical protein FB550_102400 [Neobacillus bataviensis]|uniref:PD(D/E)XK endonuclease domain-containing protein n=1 Tax=Neobacillus bataviensis TaxID=220685 RepID=A0A561DSN7_9BACI|nr:hypothetical protein [Neobacillus bataviensis]TWE06378.1 hypothetical protein FB550_102400 [Neobacillus bataviensis]
MNRYNQFDAVKKVCEILKDCGFEVARVSNPNAESDITITFNDKKANVLVRHLEKDHAYKNSPRTYKIYKVEAFDTYEERNNGLKSIDFVIGYNFNDDCFACIPINEYKDKRSTVIHEKEDTRHEYYNSFIALEEFI